MKGYARSLVYWAYVMEKMFGTVLLAVGVMWIMMTFMGGTDGYYNYESILSYIPMMGVIVMMAQGMSSVYYEMPRAISYGGTRKEVLTGMEIMVHVVFVQILAVVLLCITIFDEYYQLDVDVALRIYGALFLFATGAGNWIFAATVRFNKVVGMVVYVILILVGIAACAIVVVAQEYEPLNNVIAFGGGWGMVVVAVVFDVVMMGLTFWTSRKYEVKI